MEHIYYTPFSEQRKELRKQWDESLSIDNSIGWEDYLNKAESQIDLLEHHEMLPASVQIILVKFYDQENDYNTCCNLQSDLNEIGWNIEYGLDSEPYNLRKL